MPITHFKSWALGISCALGLICFNTRGEAPLSKHELAEVRQGALPPAVKRFVRLVEALRNNRAIAEKLRAHFIFPLTVRETAYETAGANCLRHYRVHEAGSPKDLGPALRRLAESFHGNPVHELEPAIYGVAPDEPCSHVASVAMDSKQIHVRELTVDAEDLQWTPTRRDFTSTSTK